MTPQTEALLLQAKFHVEKGIHGTPHALGPGNSQHPAARIELAHLGSRDINNCTWHTAAVSNLLCGGLTLGSNGPEKVPVTELGFQKLAVRQQCVGIAAGDVADDLFHLIVEHGELVE